VQENVAASSAPLLHPDPRAGRPGRFIRGAREAEQTVNHHSDSDWVREVERFTGAHRHRNIRVNDAGELVSY